MAEIPSIGQRVRIPWEQGTRDGVVTSQLGVDTQKPRVRIRPDGETADVEFPVDVVEILEDEEAT